MLRSRRRNAAAQLQQRHLAADSVFLLKKACFLIAYKAGCGVGNFKVKRVRPLAEVAVMEPP